MFSLISKYFFSLSPSGKIMSFKSSPPTLIRDAAEILCFNNLPLMCVVFHRVKESWSHYYSVKPRKCELRFFEILANSKQICGTLDSEKRTYS